MKTLKFALILIITATIQTITFSQSHDHKDSSNHEMKTPEERAQKRTNEMKEKLGLSEDQTKKIYDINLAHIIQMDVYREEMKALKEKMRAEKESTKKKIEAILTPEQKVKFEEEIKAREEKKKDENHQGEKPHKH